MKRALFIGLAVFTPLCVVTLVNAQGYTPIVGLPGVDSDALSTEGYVTALYALAITVACLLALFKIVFGGVKWSLSDVVTDKGDAKKDIKGALLGLLIVLSAVLVLNTINPNLTQLNIFGEGAPSIDSIAVPNPTSGFGGPFEPEPLGSNTNWDSLSSSERVAFTQNCRPGAVNITRNSAGRNIATCVATDETVVDPDLTANTAFNTNIPSIMDDFLLKQDRISNDVGTTVFPGDLKGYTSVPMEEIPGNDEIAFSQTLQPACEAAGGSHIGITGDAGAFEFWCVGNSGN